MSYSDPRFDDIVITMQQGIDTGKTPTEVLATALADIYRLGVEDASKERDELRARLERFTTSNVLFMCPECDGSGLRGTATCRDCGGVGVMNELAAERHAQYVHGLEDALQQIKNRDHCRCGMPGICPRHLAINALAAKDKSE